MDDYRMHAQEMPLRDLERRLIADDILPSFVDFKSNPDHINNIFLPLFDSCYNVIGDLMYAMRDMSPHLRKLNRTLSLLEIKFHTIKETCYFYESIGANLEAVFELFKFEHFNEPIGVLCQELPSLIRGHVAMSLSRWRALLQDKPWLRENNEVKAINRALKNELNAQMRRHARAIMVCRIQEAIESRQINWSLLNGPISKDLLESIMRGNYKVFVWAKPESRAGASDQSSDNQQHLLARTVNKARTVGDSCTAQFDPNHSSPEFAKSKSDTGSNIQIVIEGKKEKICSMARMLQWGGIVSKKDSQDSLNFSDEDEDDLELLPIF